MDFKGTAKKLLGSNKKEKEHIDGPSPEILLNKLYHQFVKLKTSALFLKNNEQEDRINEIISRLFVGNVLYGLNLMAITGTQGVGKSTLAKFIYKERNIDLSKFIIDNEARGEHIPIAIVEREASQEVEGYIYKFATESKEDLGIQKIKISAEDFQTASQSSDRDIVLLELSVPFSFFKDNDAGFLLLPGLEDNDNYSQKMVEYSLMTSTNAIFVTNTTRSAQAINHNLLIKTFDRFKEKKPLICITNTDNNHSSNVKLIETICNDLKLKNNTQIFLSGTETFIDESNWVDGLIKKLENEKYFKVTYEARTKQLESLSSFLRDEATLVLKSITNSRLDNEIVHNSFTTEITELLDFFDKGAVKTKKRFNKYLSQAVEKRKNVAIDKIETLLSKNNLGSRIGDWISDFLDGKLKANKKFRDECIKAWNSTGNGTPQMDIVFALNNVARESLAVNCLTNFENIEDKNKQEVESVLVGDLAQSYNVIDQHIINDISVMFNYNDQGKEDFSNYRENTIPLFPILGLELMRLNCAVNSHNDNGRSIWTEPEFVKDFESFNTSQKKFIATTAAILGLDYAEDGSIDSINVLLKAAVGGSGNLALANILGGLILGVGLLNMAINHTNKAILTKDAYAKALFHEYEALLLQTTEDRIDDLFEQMKERASNSLRMRFNMSESGQKKERLSKALSDCYSSIDTLREIIGKRLAIG